MTGRNGLFEALAPYLLRHGHVLSDAQDRTARGTVLERWLWSIAPGGVMPHCGHAVPGQPAILCADEAHPVIRCMACVPALLGITDDRICHLCGRESAMFREFTFRADRQLVIIGNACDECFGDIFRGNPAPRDGYFEKVGTEPPDRGGG